MLLPTQSSPFEAQAEPSRAQEHEQGLALCDQAQPGSALRGQLSSGWDRTMIYSLSFEILGPKMTECREQVARNK